MKFLLIALIAVLVSACAPPRECRLIEATIVESGPDGAWGCVSGVRTFYRDDAGGGKTCLLLGEVGDKVTVRKCAHPDLWRDFDARKTQ